MHALITASVEQTHAHICESEQIRAEWIALQANCKTPLESVFISQEAISLMLVRYGAVDLPYRLSITWEDSLLRHLSLAEPQLLSTCTF
jgi:hypothetical protein